MTTTTIEQARAIAREAAEAHDQLRATADAFFKEHGVPADDPARRAVEARLAEFWRRFAEVYQEHSGEPLPG